MQKEKKPNNPEIDDDTSHPLKKYFWGALISIIVVISIAGFLGFLYKEGIAEITELITKKTGFIGLVMIILIADSIIPAFPTDIVLLLIAKSSLNTDWGIYVLIIGITSIVAGIFGWNIGKWIREKTSFKISKDNENSKLIKKYGFPRCYNWSIDPYSIFPDMLECRFS